MLQQLLWKVRNMFSGPPVVDCVGFARLRDAHPTPEVRPGTMAEAYDLVQDAREAALRLYRHGDDDIWLPGRFASINERLVRYGAQHNRQSGWCACGRRWDISEETALVGPSSQVSRLIEPQHAIGFEVRTGAGGWSLEHLEMLDSFLQVMRRHGRVVGVVEGAIIRVESAHSLCIASR